MGGNAHRLGSDHNPPGYPRPVAQKRCASRSIRQERRQENSRPICDVPGEYQPSDRKVVCYTVPRFDPPTVTEVPAEPDIRDKREINGAATIGHETNRGYGCRPRLVATIVAKMRAGYRSQKYGQKTVAQIPLNLCWRFRSQYPSIASRPIENRITTENAESMWTGETRPSLSCGSESITPIVFT